MDPESLLPIQDTKPGGCIVKGEEKVRQKRVNRFGQSHFSDRQGGGAPSKYIEYIIIYYLGDF